MDNTLVQTDIAEIRAVRRQTTIWQWSLFSVLLLLVLICVMQMWNAGSALTAEGPGRDLFIQKLGASIQNAGTLNILQGVGAEALHSVDINKEVSKLNERAPQVASMGMEQLRRLSVNIPTAGKKVLSQQFSAALQGRAEKLQQEFPDISAVQMKGFQDSLSNLTQEQLGDVTDSLFTPHINTMNDIVADLETIKTLEGAKAQTDMPTWEMAFLISDILRADLTGSSELTATSNTPAADTVKKGKKQ